MTREVKGLIAGAAAGVIVLVSTLGVAALVTARSGSQGMPSRQVVRDPVLSARVATGRRLFLANCAPCHGSNAQGVVGPSLHALKLPDTPIENTIKNGRNGRMPAFRDRLSESDVRALISYLRSLEP